MNNRIFIGIFIAVVLVIFVTVAVVGFNLTKNYFSKTLTTQNQNIDANGPDEDESVPSPVAASPLDIAQEPTDASALGGYNVLIADRGNNRLIEVTPEKNIVWEYKFDLPKAGLGADDAFFADEGKTIIVNLELYHVIQQIDYKTKEIVWTYGKPGIPGSDPGYLNRPDDAYKLANGNVMTADIKNCRIIEISLDKRIVRQYGVTGVCKNQIGYLNKPNGDTPLPNGHVYISNIRGNNIIELDEKWHQIMSLKVPLKYPSDPQPTKKGNILIADYNDPGKIIEISKKGKVVWEYFYKDGDQKLNSPSLAVELPNGNILTNDDLNHRVVVINKNTKQIVWQYGVTGKPGSEQGQLNIPDGVDIIKRTPNLPTHTVGQITRHAKDFVNKNIKVSGYLIKRETGYLIFSDEATGAISSFDLPVTGLGIDLVQSGQKYILEGKFVEGGLESSNKNLYHLELSSKPKSI